MLSRSSLEFTKTIRQKFVSDLAEIDLLIMKFVSFQILRWKWDLHTNLILTLYGTWIRSYTMAEAPVAKPKYTEDLTDGFMYR